MLSNKLTFSLVFVVMLAMGLTFVATPVMAQDVVAIEAAPSKTLPFAVVVTDSDAASTAHISVPAGYPAVSDTLDVNLYDILQFGGTIELQFRPVATGAITADTATGRVAAALKTAATRAGELGAANVKALAPGATDAEKEAGAWHDFVITEIMWGLDGISRSAQWIEIYNNSGADLLVEDDDDAVEITAAEALRLVIHTGRRSVNEIATAQPNDADPAVNEWVVVDRVSAVNDFGIAWSELPGQSGRTTEITDADPTPRSSLISMYRVHDLNANGEGYKSDTVGNGKHWNFGTDSGSWAATPARQRINIAGADDTANLVARYMVGTPYSPHLGASGGGQTYVQTPAALPVGTVMINEVNNSDNDRLDWIELHNTGDTAVQVENWEIGIVTAVGADGESDDGAILPKHMIPAKGYLLIVTTDPSETILAAGTAIPENESALLGGAQHDYHVDSKAAMPNDKKFMLVLRNVHEKNRTHEGVVDVIGAQIGSIATDGTAVWPLTGWALQGTEDFGAISFKGGFERTGSDANRFNHEHWAPLTYEGGVGYDPKVSRLDAMGTPGYPNAAMANSTLLTEAGVTTVTAAPSVVISEIMYDAGEGGDTAQWIELYNPSLTDAVNIGGWTLEVRNKDSAESYVDSMLKFNDNIIILPNQTLLLVSYRDSNDVPANRVYNLWQHHKDDLGLLQRRSILLSPSGFYLKLSYEQADNPDADADDMITVDEAGNVTIEGASRTVNWDLEDAGRASLIRKKGATDGTAEASWRMANGVSTFYGDRNDMGSPADHEGSPLPVSLSSFRPIRDKATGEVVITWITQSELNNAGFNILRSDSKDGEFKVINLQGMIAGHGTTSEKHVYTYTDKNAKPNVAYYYQIEDVSLNGNRTTLRTTHMRGNVNVAGKLTTTWGDLKFQK